MSSDLAIVTLEGFLFSHQELSRQTQRGRDASANIHSFMADFNHGNLNRYFGTFVAYQKGVFCGQDKDGVRLYGAASRYYGESGLTVFPVPKTQLERPDLTQVLGKWQ